MQSALGKRGEESRIGHFCYAFAFGVRDCLPGFFADFPAIFSTRKSMAIRKVGVVGCGLMGSGIAQVAAAAGFATVVREVSAELVDKGLKSIEKKLNWLGEEKTNPEEGRSVNCARGKGTTSPQNIEK